MDPKTVRIAARVEPDIAEKIRQAARVSGMSVSAFVGSAAEERAEGLVSNEHVTVVPSDFFDRLLKELDEPGEPIPALKKASEQLERIIAQRESLA